MARRVCFTRDGEATLRLISVGSKDGYVPSSCVRVTACVDPRLNVDVVHAFFVSLAFQAVDVIITCASSGAELRAVVPKASAPLVCDTQWVLNTGSAKFPIKFSADEAQLTAQRSAYSQEAPLHENSP
eukprot:9133278-Pyramimonas_sp.AAC.1